MVPNPLTYLTQFDPEISEAMIDELHRQRNKIELIASENFTSLAVMMAQGSWLTNKYAEGLPGRRYYGGCECVDTVETLAIERAKSLFGAEHANVQPHSGAQANMAVFFSILKPGDTVLGMDLGQGGHLTHGSKVNISGQYFNSTSYGVNPETEQLDYDEIARIAETVRPKLMIGGASSYSRIIDFEKIGKIARSVDAYFMVDMAHIAGLVASGLHPSPIPHADFVTTTTHKTLRGPRGGLILCKESFAKQIDKSVFPGIQGGPLMHVIAAKAVALKEAMTPEFGQYQRQVIDNAIAMADEFSHLNGRIVSGGTDNHLLTLDLRAHHVTGKIIERALDAVGITVNKNLIPFDPESPFVTSGIRIGTPSVTTRGMTTADMRKIAQWIMEIVKSPENPSVHQTVADAVNTIVNQYPLYPDLSIG